jgi:NAD(P)-dependent dehydrogenase (short-subunit alcohol dehydrogenase family)
MVSGALRVRLAIAGRGSSRSAGADAVVTGAGSGIGRGFALEIARRGGRVVCADIDDTCAKETATLIGARALAWHCDVSDADAVAELADGADDWFGGPTDLVVNNAGIGAGGTVIGDLPLDLWRKTIDVNLWGVIHGCHVFAPRMRAQRRGGIINVGSAASFAAAPRMAAYNVSKAAVLALSETLAAELAGTGVAVTVLCPTFVKTNIVNPDLVDETTARLAMTAMKWTGVSPESVARAALDANDHGRLHVVPQLDAKLIWQTKRLVPATYTRALGVIERLAR